MAIRHFPRRLERRQDADPLPAPTGAGLSGVVQAATDVDTAALAFNTDSSAAGTETAAAPPLAATGPNPKSTESPTFPTATASSASDSASPTTVAASSTKQISLGTVVATCVGAFIGATAIIVFAFWMYRRYSRSLKQRMGRSRGPFNHRNMQSNGQRQRAHSENWNRLTDNDTDDKWEVFPQSKEVKESGARELVQVAPMEKLTMFKKTPSVRTAYTHKSTDGTDFSFPSSYAEFDPKLADTLKSGPLNMPEPKRVDSEPSSYLTVRSRLSGAMSPTQNMAIPTPPPIFSDAHKWESAEVVAYQEPQTAEIVHNPFDAEFDRSTSGHNPFFGASTRDHELGRGRRSTSMSSARSRSRSRSRTRANSTVSTAPPPQPSAKAKGKERMRYSTATDNTITHDPFDDNHNVEDAQDLPRPAFMAHTHTASSSVSSMENKDRERALQSLIAALDAPEDEVRDRLRIASMQPSIISNVSSIAASEADVTKAFPLPPSTPSMNSFEAGSANGHGAGART